MMITEGVDFVNSFGGESCAGSTSVDAQRLVRLNSALLAPEFCKAIVGDPVVGRAIPMILTNVANNPTISAKSRFTALSCLAALASVDDEAYRTGVLFPLVITLNASFESLLQDREDAAAEFGTSFGRQHETLVVLLFRCTNYKGLRAVDLLHQLCGGDDVRLVSLFVGVLRVRTHEWPLLRAVFRCLFELTTPTTYFTPHDGCSTSATDLHDPNAVVKVTEFQEKMTALLVHFQQSNSFSSISSALLERWQSILRHLGPSSHEVVHVAACLTHLGKMLLNLQDYSSSVPLQKAWQQGLLAQHHGFLSNMCLSFASSVLSSVWTTPCEGDECETVATGMTTAMKVVRLAFHRPSRHLVPSVTSALGHLLEVFSKNIPIARQRHIIPVLLLTLEAASNVDAVLDESLSPLLGQLLTKIAEDTEPVAGRTTLAQSLASLLMSETNVYLVLENATTQFISSTLGGSLLDELVDDIMSTIDSELQLLQLLDLTLRASTIPSDRNITPDRDDVALPRDGNVLGEHLQEVPQC